MFSRLEIKPCQFGLTHPLLLEKICPMRQQLTLARWPWGCSTWSQGALTVQTGTFLLPFPFAPHPYPCRAETPELLAPRARSVLFFFPQR